MAAVKQYASDVFGKRVSIVARYRSVDLRNGQRRTAAGAWQSMGNVDAWVVTVSGIDLPIFGTDPYATQAGIEPPRLTNVTFIVDGVTGTVLQATWA